MASKNIVDIVLDGRAVKISGYDEREYYQKLADYINEMINQFNKSDSSRRLSSEMKKNLMFINMADDYFKAKKTGDELAAELDSRNKEVYDLKHDLISSEMKTDALNKEISDLKKEINKYQKTIVKLETELNNK